MKRFVNGMILICVFSCIVGLGVLFGVEFAVTNPVTANSTTELVSTVEITDGVIVDTETVDAVIISSKVRSTTRLGINKIVMAELYIPKYKTNESIIFNNYTSLQNKRCISNWQNIKSGAVVKAEISTYTDVNADKIIKREINRLLDENGKVIFVK